MHIKVRKVDNTAAGSGSGRPPDDAEFRHLEVTRVEMAAYEALRRKRVEELRGEAPVIVGGSPGAYTFALGTDTRLRLRAAQKRYTVEAGSSVSIQLTAVDDAGAVRSALGRTVDLRLNPGGMSHSPRVVRFAFARGVASRLVTFPRSGVFQLDTGTNFRMDAAVVIEVWE